MHDGNTTLGELAKHEFVVPEGAKPDDRTRLTLYAHVRVAAWSPIDGDDLGMLEADFEELVEAIRNEVLDWYDDLPEDLRARMRVSLTTR